MVVGLLGLLLALASPALLAGPAGAEPAVTSARIGHYGAATRLVLDLSARVDFRIFTLQRPDRVVIDMEPVRWRMAERTLAIGRGLVAQLRYGQYLPEVSRIVIDLEAPVAVVQATVVPERNGASHRLVLDLKPTTRQAFAASAGAPPGLPAFAATPPAAEPPRQAAAPAAAPEPPRQAAAAPAESAQPERAPAAQPERAAEPERAPADPAATASARATPRAEINGVRRAEVAALRPPLPRSRPALAGRKVIVVDPGHGGRDPGAMAAGMREKDIALSMGRQLRDALQATGRYRVVMTRETDRYISLRKRVGVARTAGADLFLSVHADRLADPKVRGAAVYTLSDTASDAEAAELAQRENKADIVAGVDFSEGYDEEVAQILISLIQQRTMNCSATFATLLVPELNSVTALLRRSHRFAGFRVLKAPDIPSVLIEFGFLSNTRDQAMLRSPAKRAALIQAVVMAVDSYFSEPC